MKAYGLPRIEEVENTDEFNAGNFGMQSSSCNEDKWKNGNRKNSLRNSGKKRAIRRSFKKRARRLSAHEIQNLGNRVEDYD